MILYYTEKQRVLELAKARHLQHSSACAVWPSHDAKGTIYKHHWENALKELQLLEELYMPYSSKGKDKKERLGDVERLRKAWVDTYGDPNDPVVAEKIRRTNEALKARGPKKVEEVKKKPNLRTRNRITK